MVFPIENILIWVLNSQFYLQYTIPRAEGEGARVLILGYYT